MFQCDVFRISEWVAVFVFIFPMSKADVLLYAQKPDRNLAESDANYVARCADVTSFVVR
jgi:hypothetical protein